MSLDRMKRFLSVVLGWLLVVLSIVEIEDEDTDRLILNVNGGRIRFDREAQSVAYSGGRVVHFRSVQSVDVQHFVSGREFEWWVLSLQLTGGQKLQIGRSTDDVQIAIAAAHIASTVGKSVRALPRVRR